MSADGGRVDATAWHGGIGAEGGIVANAEDEARFLMALMQGELLRPAELTALKTPASSIGSDYALGFVVAQSGCAGIDYEHGGAGPGFKTSVLTSGDGKRVAVLLANGNRRTTLRTTLASTGRRSASTAPPDRRARAPPPPPGAS